MEYYVKISRETLVYFSVCLLQLYRSYHKANIPGTPCPDTCDAKEWETSMEKGWTEFKEYYDAHLKDVSHKLLNEMARCHDKSIYREIRIHRWIFTTYSIGCLLLRIPCTYIPLTYIERCEKAVKKMLEQIKEIDSAPRTVSAKTKYAVRMEMTIAASELREFLNNKKIKSLMWYAEHYAQSESIDYLTLDSILEKSKTFFWL